MANDPPQGNARPAPLPEPGSGGGSIAIRGFLAQTLVAILEVVQSGNAFESLTLEPVQGNDQFDFVWTDGKKHFAVQVKTSQNVIGLGQAQKWAARLREQRTDENCFLVLVGRFSEELAKLARIEDVELQKHALDLEAFVERAAHRLSRFLEGERLPTGTADTREQLVHAITSKLQHFATRSAPLSREVFRSLLRGWVSDWTQPVAMARPVGAEAPVQPDPEVHALTAMAPTENETLETSVVFIVDLVEYTKQCRQFGPHVTKAFAQSFFPTLKLLAAEFGLTPIRTFGDAALFHGFPNSAYPFKLFERLNGGLGLGVSDTPFRIALRCVVHYGPCALARGSDGAVVDLFGEDVVVPFRLEKHVGESQMLITSEAWKYLSQTIAKSGRSVRKVAVDLPKGFGIEDELLEEVARRAKVDLAQVQAAQQWEVRLVSLSQGSGESNAAPSIDHPSPATKAPEPTKSTAARSFPPPPLPPGVNVYPRVIGEVNALLKRSKDASAMVLRAAPAWFSPAGAGLAQLVDEAGRARLDLKLAVDGILSQRHEIMPDRHLANVLERVLGGMLVLAVDPSWIHQERKFVTAESLSYPGATFDKFAGEDHINCLALVHRALGDTPCALGDLFESSCSPDGRALPPIPELTAGISQEDKEREVLGIAADVVMQGLIRKLQPGRPPIAKLAREVRELMLHRLKSGKPNHTQHAEYQPYKGKLELAGLVIEIPDDTRSETEFLEGASVLAQTLPELRAILSPTT